MRAVIQRVSEARVEISSAEGDSYVSGRIGAGLLVLLGVSKGDTAKDADYLLDKIAGLRIFPDANGKMNLGLTETGGSLLVVSQFTLCGDCRKGRRPSFDLAAEPETARVLYEHFVAQAQSRGIPTETGVFQASMQVHLVNSGPVTFVLESR